ncbi:MAG: hypothetical protein IKE65_02965 [Clostridia bacterium]|nr:hypothetical protein [Clostridia bacterium]
MTGTQFNKLMENIEDINRKISGGGGIGIKSVEINDNGELVFTFTDDTTQNVGKVKGEDGKDGKDGAFTVRDNGVDYNVTLELIDGSPVLRTTPIIMEAESIQPDGESETEPEPEPSVPAVENE